MLAIGAFAGVREAEIKRLNWSEVDQKRGHIEIKSSKAKSARRRIIEMQPNLREWLRPYAELTGSSGVTTEKVISCAKFGLMERPGIGSLTNRR
jgi:integrase